MDPESELTTTTTTAAAAENTVTPDEPVSEKATTTTTSDVVTAAPEKSKKDGRFWLIFLSLMISVFVAALELTAVTNALPSIVEALQGSNFSWVGTAYSLASTAFLPMTGGIAEIFGRRPTMLFALALFTLGSALCGSAKNMNWLIAARTVQGLGGGAILSSTSIIVSDLVSLQERGAYNGLIGLAWAFALAIGPLVGGSLASNSNWRWIFYLNLPVCGTAIGLVLLFLHLPTPPGTLREKFSRMDWIGNIIVMGSTTAVVLALTWGGTEHPWSSAQVLVPLIVGLVGLVVFVAYEATLAKNPILPWAILAQRSSLSGYIQNFIYFLVLLAVSYYLPAYYQACKDASPVRSGVDLLSFSLSIAPIVVVAGISVTVTKKYRPQIWLAWVFFMVAIGLLTTVKADTPTARGIGATLLLGIASGILGATLYFPVLAPLPVTENAHALAFFAFGRSFAGVWGISIGATVLQNQLTKRLPDAFLQTLDGQSGVSLVYSIIPVVRFMDEPLKSQVRDAFAGSADVVWQVMTGIAGIGVLASLLMQDLPLQNLMDDRWRIEKPSEANIPLRDVEDQPHPEKPSQTSSVEA